MAIRALFSFPDTIGRPGIGTIALHQVRGLVEQGVEVVVSCTSAEADLPGVRELRATLAPGGVRIPHRAVGIERARRWHDRRTAALLRRRAADVDLVHGWPGGSVETFRVARELGIPALREIPNTHTEYAWEVVGRETRALGMALPPGHSHTPDAGRIAREREEWRLADLLLVPSEFSARTFLERGFPAERLALHRYGHDPARFFPAEREVSRDGLAAAFIGRCEPRKGLHRALRAWVESGAAERGRFVVCGSFVPGYREALGGLLEHPSVELRGFVGDPAEVMRASDVLLFPTVEEGTALVTYEAQACGCVPVVSDAAGARCEHEVHGLVHPAGDQDALTGHLRRLDRDRDLLARLRAAALAHANDLTWTAAARELAEVYERAIAALSSSSRLAGSPSRGDRA